MMATAQQTWLSELQALVTNALDLPRLRESRVAGILGDAPSTYAKSPRLWNAAFGALQLDAVYVPLDIPQDRLPLVLQLLRDSEAFLGGSVTVPYKQAVIPLLDDVDPLAARIGAVNVIVRTAQGRLMGYNTDGLGGVRALTAPTLGDSPSRLPARPEDRGAGGERSAAGGLTLAGARVLLLGAGGAAQALAFCLWEQMGEGQLLIANRTRSSAQGLATRVAQMRAGSVTAMSEGDLARHATTVDLIINATVKGQGGIRTLARGQWTTLEPYSALAPASPIAIPPTAQAREFLEAWYPRSLEDLQRNHEASLEICGRLPRSTMCYDIIYAPLESVFLRHARWSGHQTLNGKAMNVMQAAEAFTRYVCRDWLASRGLDGDGVMRQVAQVMAEQWS